VNYVPFAHKFLVERFHKREILLKRLQAADISAFVLRHAHTMGCRRAQLMTTAFRSFFRFLFPKRRIASGLGSRRTPLLPIGGYQRCRTASVAPRF
jgi:hypothetical protein